MKKIVLLLLLALPFAGIAQKKANEIDTRVNGINALLATATKNNAELKPAEAYREAKLNALQFLQFNDDEVVKFGETFIKHYDEFAYAKEMLGEDNSANSYTLFYKTFSINEDEFRSLLNDEQMKAYKKQLALTKKPSSTLSLLFLNDKELAAYRAKSGI